MSTSVKNLVSPQAVAAHLDMTVQALATMRFRGEGPAYVKVGRRVRYNMADVEQWIDAQTVRPGDAA